jgi:hypothetical protein
MMLSNVDACVFGIANLFNLLTGGMFLLRAVGRAKVGQILGWAAVGLGLPLASAAWLNFQTGRAWAYWALPLIVVLYCLLEFVLDGVLKSNFRRTRLLGPYLGVYYLGLMALIGYAFLVGKVFGFVTLGTYFMNLAATLVSYQRVGHA